MLWYEIAISFTHFSKLESMDLSRVPWIQNALSKERNQGNDGLFANELNVL